MRKSFFILIALFKLTLPVNLQALEINKCCSGEPGTYCNPYWIKSSSSPLCCQSVPFYKSKKWNPANINNLATEVERIIDKAMQLVNNIFINKVKVYCAYQHTNGPGPPSLIVWNNLLDDPKPF